MNQFLLDHLVCPRDHTRLEASGQTLTCEHGHIYPLVDDIPIMLLEDVEQTLWVADRSLALAADQSSLDLSAGSSRPSSKEVDAYVQDIVAATCGNLYKPLVDHLAEYPIPELRLPAGSGQLFLDIGCNWGRWCVAAARLGYRPVGIDPSLESILAARRVCRQLGVQAVFVVGDARFLPFDAGSFDTVFSYSVLQHFSKDNVRLALAEVARTLKPGGFSLIQMPNAFGIRSLYNQARRGFREGRDFEVRFWTVPELKRTFGTSIGATEMSVDGYFGLGIQKSDVRLLPRHYQLVVYSSEILRALSQRLNWMAYVADSVYAKSVRPLESVL